MWYANIICRINDYHAHTNGGNSTPSMQSPSVKRNTPQYVLYRWKCNSVRDLQLSCSELIIIAVPTLAKQRVAHKLGRLVEDVEWPGTVIWRLANFMGKLSVLWSREFFQKRRDTNIADKFKAFLETCYYYIFQNSLSVAFVLSHANPLISTYIIPVSVRHSILLSNSFIFGLQFLLHFFAWRLRHSFTLQTTAI